MTDSEYAGWHHVTYSAAQLQRGGRETKAACEMPYAAYGITETQPYEYIHFSIHSAPVSGCVPFDRIMTGLRRRWCYRWLRQWRRPDESTLTRRSTPLIIGTSAGLSLRFREMAYIRFTCEFLSYVTTIGQIFDVSCTPDAWFFAACTYCTVCKLCVCVFLIPATICINDLC